MKSVEQLGGKAFGREHNGVAPNDVNSTIWQEELTTCCPSFLSSSDICLVLTASAGVREWRSPVAEDGL